MTISGPKRTVEGFKAARIRLKIGTQMVERESQAATLFKKRRLSIFPYERLVKSIPLSRVALMDNDKFIRDLAASAQAFAEPIDFDQLIKSGLLIRKGRSFYVTDLEALPEKVSKRIKEIAITKHGVRVSFYKESKSLKKLANQLGNYL